MTFEMEATPEPPGNDFLDYRIPALIASDDKGGPALRISSLWLQAIVRKMFRVPLLNFFTDTEFLGRLIWV